mmetsp:Transcript_17611/g.42431  ORF Transcript_17611/g.42431 Transcript_17611/m.42431 type:complete len:280 (-) Transcript_17611:345-1184(-)
MVDDLGAVDAALREQLDRLCHCLLYLRIPAVGFLEEVREHALLDNQLLVRRVGRQRLDGKHGPQNRHLLGAFQHILEGFEHPLLRELRHQDRVCRQMCDSGRGVHLDSVLVEGAEFDHLADPGAAREFGDLLVVALGLAELREAHHRERLVLHRLQRVVHHVEERDQHPIAHHARLVLRVHREGVERAQGYELRLQRVLPPVLPQLFQDPGGAAVDHEAHPRVLKLRKVRDREHRSLADEVVLLVLEAVEHRRRGAVLQHLHAVVLRLRQLAEDFEGVE